jgi:hypothetical protein
MFNLRSALGVVPALVLAACAAHELDQEGAQVATSNSAPSSQGFDPKRCRSLGVVVGKGGGQMGGAWISNEDLVTYAMNDMRNKAAALGANYIQNDSPQLTGNKSTTTTATVSGTAYDCEGRSPLDPVAEDATPSQESGAKDAPKPGSVTPPTGVAGFTMGSNLEAAQKACEAKFAWSKSGDDVYECTGTPKSIGSDARSVLKFCAGSLCKAVFVVRPASDASSEWLRQFVGLKKNLVAKYGEPVEDKDVPAACVNDLLPCVSKGTAHVKYSWSFPNGTFVVLVLGNKPGPDAVIRLTYGVGEHAEAPAL